MKAALDYRYAAFRLASRDRYRALHFHSHYQQV